MNPKSRTGSRRSRGRTRPSHERGRTRENVAFQAQLLVLPSQPGQFLAFGHAQAGISSGLDLPAALLPIGLGHPIADRLGRGFKLASQIGRVTPGTNQLDHLAPELRRIGRMRLGHKDTSRKSIVGVHQTGATSVHAVILGSEERRPSYTTLASSSSSYQRPHSNWAHYR